MDINTTPTRFVRLTGALALAVALTALGACSTPARDRHFALRAESASPRPGNGVALTDRLPVEGLLAGATQAVAYPARAPVAD